MLVAAALGHAQEGVSYGYCSDEIEGCGFTVDGKYWIVGAFKMTDADVSQFDGCEITGVSIGFGSGRNKDIKIFHDRRPRQRTVLHTGRTRKGIAVVRHTCYRASKD